MQEQCDIHEDEFMAEYEDGWTCEMCLNGS